MSGLVIFPAALKAYSGPKLYYQLLPILAPAVVSAFWFLKGKTKMAVIISIIVIQFLCSSFLVHQMLGTPYSEYYSKEGSRYGTFYIHEEEVKAAEWIMDKYGISRKVYLDYTPTVGRKVPDGALFMLAEPDYKKRPEVYPGFFRLSTPRVDSLIFLRKVNTETGLAYDFTTKQEPLEIDRYGHLFKDAKLVYNQEGVEVWETK